METLSHKLIFYIIRLADLYIQNPLKILCKNFIIGKSKVGVVHNIYNSWFFITHGGNLD